MRMDITPFVILKLDTAGKNKEQFIELIELTVDNALNSELNKYRDDMLLNSSPESIFKYILASCKAQDEKYKMMEQFKRQVDIIYNKIND